MSIKIKISVIFVTLTLKGIIFILSEESLAIFKDDIQEHRIAGGYRPEKHTLAKFVVSIRMQQESKIEFGYTHFCAGSILRANLILTAAHCLYENGKKHKTSDIIIVAKSPFRLVKTTNTQELYPKEVIIHPGYNEVTMFNDIALLVLANNIYLDEMFAAKLFLPKENFKEGTLCTIVGWGKLYMHGPLANELLYVNLTLQSRKYCRQRYPHFSGKKLCALDRQDYSKDACVGDSGGPLICDGLLTGIVSYGYGCAYGTAGIYTNVFKYIDWIAKGSSNTIDALMVLFFVNFVLLIV